MPMIGMANQGKEIANLAGGLSYSSVV